jgi:TonB family protein
MYWNFFALREDPFGLTPDSRFLYLTDSHSEVLSTLKEGIEAERGFVALVSQPGVGKTTLLHALREQLAEQAVTAFVFQTGLEPLAILRILWKELGLDASQADLVKMHQQFEVGLAKVAAMGKQFVLFIDEAQGLSPAALETIRLFSNFETGRRKMVEIVLAGHPEMEHLLARPGLEHIRQRVSVFCRLQPLNQDESVQYIRHRLNVAGTSGPEIFTEEALQVLASYGKGIPRTLNIYAFQAMMKGSKRSARTLDATLVREAIHQFEGWPLPSSEARQFAAMASPRSASDPEKVRPAREPERDNDFFATEKDPALQELLSKVLEEKRATYADEPLALPDSTPPPFVPSAAPQEPVRIMPGFLASAAAPAPAPDAKLDPKFDSKFDPKGDSKLGPKPVITEIAETVHSLVAAKIAVMPSRETARSPEAAVVTDREKEQQSSVASSVGISRTPQDAMKVSADEKPAKTAAASTPASTRPPNPGAVYAASERYAAPASDKKPMAFVVAALVLISVAVSVWVVAKELRSRRGAATAASARSFPSITSPVPTAQPITQQSAQPAVTTIDASTPKASPPVKAQPVAAVLEKPQRRATTPVPSSASATPSGPEIRTGTAPRIAVATDTPAPALPSTNLGNSAMPNLASALPGPANTSIKLKPFSTPPVPSEQSRPEYPFMARQLRLSGEVVLKVQVNKRGRATSVKVVSGHPVLAAAAQNSVKNFWRFHPAMQNGEAVDGEAEVRVIYRPGGN